MPDITISKATAEKLYDLYNNIAAADTIFQRCQSDNFRVHVKSVYQAASIENAFAALKEQIDKAEDAPISPKSARRGILDKE